MCHLNFSVFNVHYSDRHNFIKSPAVALGCDTTSPHLAPSGRPCSNIYKKKKKIINNYKINLGF